jgi:hypothetical protein
MPDSVTGRRHPRTPARADTGSKTCLTTQAAAAADAPGCLSGQLAPDRAVGEGRVVDVDVVVLRFRMMALSRFLSRPVRQVGPTVAELTGWVNSGITTGPASPAGAIWMWAASSGRATFWVVML